MKKLSNFLRQGGYVVLTARINPPGFIATFYTPPLPSTFGSFAGAGQGRSLPALLEFIERHVPTLTPHTDPLPSKMTLQPSMQISLDQRELATIIAALQFHHDENVQHQEVILDQVIHKLATHHGKFKSLTYFEIATLIKKLQAHQ